MPIIRHLDTYIEPIRKLSYSHHIQNIALLLGHFKCPSIFQGAIALLHVVQVLAYIKKKLKFFIGNLTVSIETAVVLLFKHTHTHELTSCDKRLIILCNMLSDIFHISFMPFLHVVQVLTSNVKVVQGNLSIYIQKLLLSNTSESPKLTATTALFSAKVHQIVCECIV